MDSAYAINRNLGYGVISQSFHHSTVPILFHSTVPRSSESRHPLSTMHKKREESGFDAIWHLSPITYITYMTPIGVYHPLMCSMSIYVQFLIGGMAFDTTMHACYHIEFMILQGSARPEVRSELYKELKARI